MGFSLTGMSPLRWAQRRPFTRLYGAWPRLLTCVATGAALAQALEWEAAFALAWFAIALWLIMIDGRSRRMAAVLGACFGAGLAVSGLHWLFRSLDANDAPWAAHVLPCLGMLIPVVFSSIIGSLAAGSVATRAWRWIAIVPAAWTLLDWSRHLGDIALPWLVLGNTQIPLSPLAGIGPHAGVLGIGFLTALLGGLLALAWVESAQRGRWIGAGLAAAAAAFAAGAVSSVKPTDAPVRVALVQGNQTPSAGYGLDGLADTLSDYAVMIRRADADLIVLPENAVPVPAQFVRDFLLRVASHAQGSGKDVLVGAYELQDDRQYSTALAVGVSGTQRYRKQRLVPFGEFVPWKPVFARLFLQGDKDAAPRIDAGTADQPTPVLAGVRVGVMLCFEDVFGDGLRPKVATAGLLVDMANDGWIDSPALQRQHLRFAQARALETGRPVVRAANTGISVVIDPGGRIDARLPTRSAAVLETEVMPQSGLTAFVRWGSAPVVAASFLMLLAGSLRLGYRRREPLPSTQPTGVISYAQSQVPAV